MARRMVSAMRWRCCMQLAGLLALVSLSNAQADTLLLHNGDRLTGTLISIADETIAFETVYAGVLKVEQRVVVTARLGVRAGDAPPPRVAQLGRRLEPLAQRVPARVQRVVLVRQHVERHPARHRLDAHRARIAREHLVEARAR